MEIEAGQLQRKQQGPAQAAGGSQLALLKRSTSNKSLAEFAEKALGWVLEDKQRELLSGPSKRVILNCTRQWGKSWMAAALVFHAVHEPESLSIVAGPTLRQFRRVAQKSERPGVAHGVACAGGWN